MTAEIESCPLTVVGAGPAGIVAASTAAAAGVDVIVVDENPSPGGQYYRQSPPEFDILDRAAAHSGHPEAAALYDQLDHPNIRVLQGVRVWGVFDEHTLALTDEKRTFLLNTDRVVLATGASDRPLAFPGWTLPGVVGVAATLRLIKSQWVLPGQRFLLAGLGPLQLVLADLLLKSGAEVVCVAEAANPLQGWRHLPGLWGHWDRLREAYEYRRALSRNKVPLLFNHVITSASGDDRVAAAEIARIDQDGVPIPKPSAASMWMPSVLDMVYCLLINSRRRLAAPYGSMKICSGLSPGMMNIWKLPCRASSLPATSRRWVAPTWPLLRVRWLDQSPRISWAISKKRNFGAKWHKPGQRCAISIAWLKRFKIYTGFGQVWHTLRVTKPSFVAAKKYVRGR